MTRACKHCGISIEGSPSKNIYCSKPCGNHASKNKRHGLSGTREHAAWLDMRNRCRNPDAHNYARYGARGITVCDRWDVFENFLVDMGLKPGNGYSIERVNNDGNYEPSNCKWATQAEQNKNRCNAYTAEQDQKIKDGVASGYNFKQIAAFVGRPLGSVQTRAYRLGLKSKKSADPGSRLPLQTPHTIEKIEDGA